MTWPHAFTVSASDPIPPDRKRRASLLYNTFFAAMVTCSTRASKRTWEMSRTAADAYRCRHTASASVVELCRPDERKGATATSAVCASARATFHPPRLTSPSSYINKKVKYLRIRLDACVKTCQERQHVGLKWGSAVIQSLHVPAVEPNHRSL